MDQRNIPKLSCKYGHIYIYNSIRTWKEVKKERVASTCYGESLRERRLIICYTFLIEYANMLLICIRNLQIKANNSGLDQRTWSWACAPFMNFTSTTTYFYICTLLLQNYIFLHNLVGYPVLIRFTWPLAIHNVRTICRLARKKNYRNM